MRKGYFLPVLLLCMLLLMISASADVVINEVMLRTATYVNGKAYEWVELYNNGKQSLDLKGMTLTYTRKEKDQSYTIDRSYTLKPGKYAVIYLTGSDKKSGSGNSFYAPIDVSSKGGTFDLYGQDGISTSTVTLEKQYCDVSWGLVNGTRNSWKYLAQATCGSQNSDFGYDERAAKPVLSVSGGFYDQCPPVYVMAEDGAVIRYTTNGSTPDESSKVWADGTSFPQGVTALRLRAFVQGKLPSQVVTQSFFIGIGYDISIVSLVTDNQYTTNGRTGLLVKGPGEKPNYAQKWEYPVNVEYFNPSHKQEINQMATFRISGATSRKFGQKAITLYARGALGSSSFKFNPFSNRENRTSYKSFTLRAGGTECYKTRFKDALLTGLAYGEDIIYQEATPCLVYINGEFYGLANIREKINKYSLAAYEGITDESVMDGVTIVKGRTGVTNGSLREWQNLISYMKSYSLADEKHLEYVMERMDVENYLTMVAFQMITGNNDIGNQRLYKFEGGKFRWVLYDLDAAMQSTNRVPIGYFTKGIRQSNDLFYHEPFAALMKNQDMKDLFLIICGRLMAQLFNPRNMNDLIDEWVAKLQPYMSMQIKRWPGCSPKAISSWKYEVNAFRKVATTRPRAVMKYLISHFKLNDDDKEYYFGDFLTTLD